MSARFRLWITCVPLQSFPISILQSCVKVAVQQAQTLREQASAMVQAKRFQEKDSFFKKSGRNSKYHKNIFFGLMYFHALVTNRRHYGVLGWNVPYAFEASDFDISCAQLATLMRPSAQTSGAVPLRACLDTLRYFYAHVNYAGRV